LDTREFDLYLAELENRLERLRVLYEQYFMGMERIEPQVARKDVDRRFWTLRKTRVNNTARKFRLQTLLQRYNTLQQYWQRTCRQIENGTYTRHVARARRRFGDDALPRTTSVPAQSESPSATENAVQQTEVDLGALLMAEMDTDEVMRSAVEAAFDAIAAESSFPPPLPAKRPKPSRVPTGAPARPPPGKAATPKRDTTSDAGANTSEANTRAGSLQRADARRLAASAPTSPSGTRSPPAKAPAAQRAGKSDRQLSEAQINGLYDELIAKRSSLKQVGSVNRASLARSLRATEAKLRQAHAGRNVEFRVDIANGKATIKPIVR
jgi:hypothetical protein